MFRHVVSFRLKDDKKDIIDEVKKRLLALDAIPQVKSVQVGIDDLKSARSFDFVLIMDFENLDTYKEYDQHELHQPVREFVHDIVSDSVSVDYFID
jgi:hypothetical protein